MKFKWVCLIILVIRSVSGAGAATQYAPLIECKAPEIYGSDQKLGDGTQEIKIRIANVSTDDLVFHFKAKVDPQILPHFLIAFFKINAAYRDGLLLRDDPQRFVTWPKVLNTVEDSDLFVSFFSAFILEHSPNGKLWPLPKELSSYVAADRSETRLDTFTLEMKVSFIDANHRLLHIFRAKYDPRVLPQLEDKLASLEVRYSDGCLLPKPDPRDQATFDHKYPTRIENDE